MKPEQTYRSKIDPILEQYFFIEREVYSTNGKRIDYILKCKKTGVLLGLEVKSEIHKTGISIASYLDQAKCYSNELWKTSYNNSPCKVMVFITPAISKHIKEINTLYKPIIKDGIEYNAVYHGEYHEHSNVSSWISSSYGIGELRSHKPYNNCFAFIFNNFVIWEALGRYGVRFYQDKYNKYVNK